MAKTTFVGGFFNNKWVKISIYAVLTLLIVWVLYLLAKKFLDMVTTMTTEEKSDKAIQDLTDEDNEYPDTTLSDAEAMTIADTTEGAFSEYAWGMGTVCETLFDVIEPYRNDPNALRKIYKSYGKRDVGDGKMTLFQQYKSDLSVNCTNGCDFGFSLYPCDVPSDCGCGGRDYSELSCMRWYWENSGLGGL